jgi:hypothetical protein
VECHHALTRKDLGFSVRVLTLRSSCWDFSSDLTLGKGMQQLACVDDQGVRRLYPSRVGDPKGN